MLIDIGGTPAFIVKQDLLSITRQNEIESNQLVAILDPFDLSRAERKLELGDYKTKSLNFSVEVPNGWTELSSEFVSPPKPEECMKLFDSAESCVLGKLQSVYGKRINISEINSKYALLRDEVERLARESGNLRDFMNGLTKILLPDIRTIKLENILSQNKSVVYRILEKTDIGARIICPRCNMFYEDTLRKENSVCTKCNMENSNRQIIDSGRYIPQQGILPVITCLCGYLTFSNNSDKVAQTNEIFDKLGVKGSAIMPYKAPEKGMTLFERFILGDSNKYKNAGGVSLT
jgi:hypothetical protein